MWRAVGPAAALALVASAVSAAKSQQNPTDTARIAEGRTLFRDGAGVASMRRAALITLGAVVLIGACYLSAEGQQRSPTPPLVISSLYGRDLFQFYCATCHGRDAKGDGPVASSLKHQPPDLTTIAARNGSRFPRERIERFVSGDDVSTSAHGSREMPVWGPIFRSLDPRDSLTRIRISNVVQFIESIQSK